MALFYHFQLGLAAGMIVASDRVRGFVGDCEVWVGCFVEDVSGVRNEVYVGRGIPIRVVVGVKDGTDRVWVLGAGSETKFFAYWMGL
jgi:hypothetical protein